MTLCMEHDLFGKPASTCADHALFLPIPPGLGRDNDRGVTSGRCFPGAAQHHSARKTRVYALLVVRRRPGTVATPSLKRSRISGAPFHAAPRPGNERPKPMAISQQRKTDGPSFVTPAVAAEL